MVALFSVGVICLFACVVLGFAAIAPPSWPSGILHWTHVATTTGTRRVWL
jgi:hypothetical protein